MQYQILGPFDIERDAHRKIDRKQHALWEEVDEALDGASEGCGVYIFGLRAGRGTKPWYVGKAERQPFRKECFTDNKLRIYYEALMPYQRVTPVLQLVVRLTKTGRISKPTSSYYDDVDKLEDMLIGHALRRNPALSNIASTKILREMQVPGLINDTPGKPTKAVSEFKKLLGL